MLGAVACTPSPVHCVLACSIWCSDPDGCCQLRLQAGSHQLSRLAHCQPPAGSKAWSAGPHKGLPDSSGRPLNMDHCPPSKPALKQTLACKCRGTMCARAPASAMHWSTAGATQKGELLSSGSPCMASRSCTVSYTLRLAGSPRGCMASTLHHLRLSASVHGCLQKDQGAPTAGCRWLSCGRGHMLLPAQPEPCHTCTCHAASGEPAAVPSRGVGT